MAAIVEAFWVITVCYFAYVILCRIREFDKRIKQLEQIIQCNNCCSESCLPDNCKVKITILD